MRALRFLLTSSPSIMLQNPSTASGHPVLDSTSDFKLNTVKSASNRNPQPRRSRAGQGKPTNVRPTHFLSLPIGHHPELRARIKALHERVLSPDATAIEGIDKSILVDPRRLHFTLGVMALSPSAAVGTSPPSITTPAPPTHTLDEAIALLRSLEPAVAELTEGPLRVPLNKMGVLKMQKGQAGVLYLGPKDEKSEDTMKLRRVLELVNRRFREEGFISDPERPAVLHCTIVNASHRKPRRMPRTFSYREIFEMASGNDTNSKEQYVDVDFGSWLAPEIQLCVMGIHGPENEYVSCASIPLVKPKNEI
ncbi:hypothetical protein MIND_00885800 [Mycena indigotica]|uniref:A-kinase anchor protein 7-like phosphoesterase domain-containing protein n=1 Tax=Mycena indigotica TaxID=2126181 RepID=A0A8H6SK96_9AGAR|nr:uncharacterized protein MIND_00885800 [Mycena indigotica]KAF7299365.1 hypothetical protein MIND_00885800 [Mycena indigotica]